MMYEEAREYLENITRYGSILGLDSIRELLRRLGNPQNDLKFVHVAGTNGKGSTVAFVSTILKNAGYRTGRYTSPSVFSYREKIQVDESYISKDALADSTQQIKNVIDEMYDEGFSHPTIFEVETALAFLYFKREMCDIVVLETGLGGLLDATNIVENTLVCILTSISLDHMEFLGDTIEEIAANKAGIIKSGSIVVSTKQDVGAMNVIERRCREVNNTLIIADKNNASQIRSKDFKISFNYKDYKDIEIGLLGSYQIENAIVSIEVIEALRRKGLIIDEEDMRLGLKQTKWLGRFSVISDNPMVILDGAHNEAAALSLKETIDTHLANKKLVFVIGVFADKDYKKIIQITASLACLIVTITIPNNKRALDGETLAKIAEKYNDDVLYVSTIEEAARVCLKQKEADAVIAFGSLSYLSEFAKCIKAIQ